MAFKFPTLTKEEREAQTKQIHDEFIAKLGALIDELHLIKQRIHNKTANQADWARLKQIAPKGSERWALYFRKYPKIHMELHNDNESMFKLY